MHRSPIEIGSGHWIKYNKQVTLTLDLDFSKYQQPSVRSECDAVSPAERKLHQITNAARVSLLPQLPSQCLVNHFICCFKDVSNFSFIDQPLFVALSCNVLTYVEDKVTGMVIMRHVEPKTFAHTLAFLRHVKGKC